MPWPTWRRLRGASSYPPRHPPGLSFVTRSNSSPPCRHSHALSTQSGWVKGVETRAVIPISPIESISQSASLTNPAIHPYTHPVIRLVVLSGVVSSRPGHEPKPHHLLGKATFPLVSFSSFSFSSLIRSRTSASFCSISILVLNSWARRLASISIFSSVVASLTFCFSCFGGVVPRLVFFVSSRFLV